MVPRMSVFLKSKVARQIQYNGSVYIFSKHLVDEFGQVSDQLGEATKVNGLFHTVNSYIKNTDSESARIISKPQPRILALAENSHKVEKDDVVEIEGKRYKVTGICDVNNFGVVNDISLELEV